MLDSTDFACLFKKERKRLSITGQTNFKPITKNPTAAMSFRVFSGIIEDIDPPAKAPSKLARTRADAEPMKTANGFLEVPLIATVASWVLSPSSAKKTVMKVEISNGVITIGSYTN